MASIRFLVIAVVLGVVLADLPSEEELKKMGDAATDACRNESKQCFRVCQFKSFGILDKDGRYVESEALKALTLLVYDGKLNQEQVKKIAKICNSVNEDIKTGCERGDQVFQCVDDEKFKITGKRL
ncbi:uncharacterized protein LOC133531501 [Cydia pomonella]|uniref:uncharacterized protein LOC133531501 n=1 Tax=Cydia pomonella TaxID=82600 RepID=UPI002ADD37F8|nr:uncharacterized protein LOC133531501 [Cydia pomonella]